MELHAAHEFAIAWPWIAVSVRRILGFAFSEEIDSDHYVKLLATTLFGELTAQEGTWESQRNYVAVL